MIRDATALDVPALASLHVTTWNATHGWRPNGPTYELRERQWRDAFGYPDGSWFCLVVERPNSALVGFAKGMLYDGDLQGFGGELNKIYLLREYQRQGLGRRLVGNAARRFLSQGITSMVLFGEVTNPSCRFWEVLSGERLYSANGEFHGGCRIAARANLTASVATGQCSMPASAAGPGRDHDRLRQRDGQIRDGEKL
jgi:GNAT superfamily N-acetyltransferase